MKRRDFSILAGSGLLAAPAFAKANPIRTSRQDRTYKSVGSSTRVITSMASSTPRPLYSLTSHSTVEVHLTSNGSSTVKGRSIRTVSCLYDRSLDPSTIQVMESSEWSGEFEYHLEQGVLFLYCKMGTFHGLFNDGPYQGKTFEEEFMGSGNVPHLMGTYSRDQQSMVFSTPQVFMKKILISGGIERTENWNYIATAVRV